MTDQSATAHQPKRIRLIESSAAVFSQVGFDRASVEEIAANAGVGKGTVYLYFDSKEEMFLSVLWEIKARLEDALEPTGKESDPVRAFITSHLLLAEDAADLFRCYVSALFGVNRRFQSTALEIFGWQQSCLQECMKPRSSTGPR